LPIKTPIFGNRQLNYETDPRFVNPLLDDISIFFQKILNSVPFFTKGIPFAFGDSGKTAYFAVQIENEGKEGPWEPLVYVLIP